MWAEFREKKERQKMRTTQRAMSIILIILSPAAGSLVQETTTDYDRNTGVSCDKTFSFEKVDTKGALWVDRITGAIGGELTAKGVTQVASGGDIAIAIGLTTDRQTPIPFMTPSLADGDGVGAQAMEMQRQQQRPVQKEHSSLAFLTERRRHCTGVALLTTLCPTVLRKTSGTSIKAWKGCSKDFLPNDGVKIGVNER
jgi:hypothetical protein